MSIPRVNLLKSTRRKSLFLALVLLGLLGLMLFDWDEWRSGKREEQEVALSVVPAPVKATIEQEAKLGTVGDIEKMTVGGKTVYAASFLVNGNEQETRIGEDGKVIGRGAAKRDDDGRDDDD